MIVVSSAARGFSGAAASGAVPRLIAHEAARLFAARGYDATPVREIAQAAGVTKPTLYYHFGSKEGLAQAVLIQPLTRLVAALDQVLETEADSTAATVRMAERMFAHCCEDPDRSRFLHSLFFGPRSSALALELDRHAGEIERVWFAVGRRLAASNVIDPERADAFIVNLRGVIVIHTMLFLYRGVPLDPKLPGQLVDDLLRGFRRRRSSS